MNIAHYKENCVRKPRLSIKRRKTIKKFSLIVYLKEKVINVKEYFSLKVKHNLDLYPHVDKY